MTDKPQVKKCSKCGEIKSTSEFNKWTKGALGLCSQCKMCRRQCRQDKKDAIKQARRKHREKNKDAINAASRQRHHNKWFVVANNNVRRAYGVSIIQYWMLRDAQENKCDICFREMTSDMSDAQACLDHDHNTGTLRAFLCSRCNTLEGYAKRLLTDNLTTDQILENLKHYINHKW
jgi:hypothetical protein